LAEDQLGHLDHLGVVLLDPVAPGQPAVERAILDVAGHLLGADQRAVDLRVVDGRVVTAAGEGDLVARLAEQPRRRVLEAARGDAQLEDLLAHFVYTALGSKTRSPTTSSPPGVTRRKKQL